MTQVGEAIARYHKLIESEPYIDLGWAKALQERMRAEKLTNRPISPVLRPLSVASSASRGGVCVKLLPAGAVNAAAARWTYT